MINARRDYRSTQTMRKPTKQTHASSRPLVREQRSGRRTEIGPTKAVSIRTRAADVDGHRLILAYSLTSAPERDEEEWAHMSIVAYVDACSLLALVVSLSLSLSLSLSSDPPFGFIPNGRLFVREDSDGAEPTRLLYDFTRDPLCTHTLCNRFVHTASNRLVRSIATHRIGKVKLEAETAVECHSAPRFGIFGIRITFKRSFEIRIDLEDR